jgi:hypothetical protein
MGDSQAKQIGDQFTGRIGDMLDQGPPGFYNRSMYTGAGNTTRRAWRLGTDFNQDLIAGGGLTGGQRDAMGDLGQVDNGYAGLGRGNGLSNGQDAAMRGVRGVGDQYGRLASGNGLSNGQDRAVRNMRGLGGEYADLGEAYDPNSEAYQTLRQGITDDTLGSVNSMFGGSGRLGSGLNYTAASKGLGNALAGLDYSNMQNDINNQYRSLDSRQGVYGNVFNMGQQGIDNRFNALAGQRGAFNDQFGMGQQGVDNRFNALAGRRGVANDRFGMGQQGINNNWNAIGGIGQIGAAGDADRQARRLGEMDLWNRQNFGDIDWLTRLNGAMGGGAADGANEPSWWQSLLGGAIGIGGRALGGGAFGNFGPGN